MRTSALTKAQTETLGRLVELDLRDRDVIDEHDVSALLQNGATARSPLYVAGHWGSDAQFRRIVRAARAARQERADMAAVLGN